MKYIYPVLAMALSLFLFSCKKYLDKKPDQELVIPSTLFDLQALLDNHSNMITKGVSWGEASADNYYISDVVYQTSITESQELYTWQLKKYNRYPNDWANLYIPVYYSNLVLEILPDISKTVINAEAWDNVKGTSLFHRSRSYLHGSFLFANAWDNATAATDYGMVLRNTTDFNLPSVRASLHETDNQLIADFKEAATLLPDNPVHVIRPSKAAAYGYLARAYLSMRKYDSCFKYANLALQIKNSLMDYNKIQVSASSTRTFTRFNEEVVFQSQITFSLPSFSTSRARVDSILYLSYDANDLRKKLFFLPQSDGYRFRGTYDGFNDFFNGLATDELYLMRAESRARTGDANGAMDDLNTLMVKRWKAGTFIPFVANTPAKALKIILEERRKELLFRGLRWMDIKRLNKEGADIQLTRKVQGNIFTLAPNDKRYALPLPDDLVTTFGIPQNPY